MPTHTLDTKPWIVPNFVSVVMPPSLRQDGIKIDQGIPLAEVSAETLAGMCDEFRREIFRKAGKSDPDVKVFRG